MLGGGWLGYLTIVLAVVALFATPLQMLRIAGPLERMLLPHRLRDAETLAATADIPALEGFARSVSMVFAKVPPPDGARADQYSVDHSATIAVLDPQARMAGVITPPFVPEAIARDLLALSKGAAR